MKRLFALLLCLLCSVAAHAADLTNSIGEWYFWAKDDVRIYARSMGKSMPGRDPVIVLHGGVGAEHGYLIPALEPLFTRHQFVFFDQRGSLRSPADAGKLSVTAMVSDIEQLRNELGIEKVTLLAHSMGTMLAYAYLAKYPQHVGNLVLIGPVFPFYSGAGPDKELLAQLELPTDESGDYVKQLKQLIEAQFAAYEKNADAQRNREGLDHDPRNGQERTAQWQISFAAANIHDIHKWRQMQGGQAFYNPYVYGALVKNAGGDDAWRASWKPYFPALQAYRGRISFIIGKQDFIDAQQRFWPPLLKQLPQAKAEFIDQAGHNIWVDQPASFTAAVEQALQN